MKKNYTFLSLVIAMLFANVLTAQTFVKSDATGANDGTSWANAYSDLSDALNNSAPLDEIWVAAGTYKPGGATPDTASFFTFPHDLLLYGGFAGTETMLSERDWAANETILSGDHLDNDVDNDFDTFRDDNSLHVMWLTDTVTTASTVDGFTVRNGDTSPGAASGDDRRGGGIFTYGAPAIRNCLFTQNNGYFGGGLYPRGSTTATGVIIENCVFENNASGRQGGGIYLLAGAAATISDCTFSGNTAANRGGAIYNNLTASSIINCTFSFNSVPSSAGGALMIRNGNDDTFDPVNIVNCTFENNESGFGGAMGVYDSKTIVNVTDCDFISNTAVTSGGATTNGFRATSNFTNCNFSQNEARFGGAIYSQNTNATININNCDISFNEGERGGAINIGNGDNIDSLAIPILTIENSKIQNNNAIEQGGGINLGSANAVFSNVLFDANLVLDANSIGGAVSINTSDTIFATIDFINCTLGNNIAAIGAGISHWIEGDTSSSILTLQNTVFNNPDGNDYEIEAGEPTLVSNGGNLSADLSLFDKLTAMNDLVGEDPLFVDLLDQDYHLANGSPCIDAGIEADAPTLDIEGSPRVDGVDMGAYENQKVVSVSNLPNTLGTLDIFPNPVQDDLNFTFESSFNGNLDILITDMKGHLVMNFVIDKNTEKMSRVHNVTKLPRGVYQLTISNGNELTTKAFVK
ncbi:MAG: T9SS type A sorting domain-containing protein [Saprospiraceae bacterium]